MRGRIHRLIPGVLVATAVLMSGCGTRVDKADVVADAGAGSVSLPPQVVAQLRDLSTQLPEVIAQLRAAAAPAPAALAASTGSTVAAPDPTLRRPRAAAAVAAPQNAAIPKVQSPSAAAPASGCAKPGAPVGVGQIGNFSGVAGPIASGARTALAVWAQLVNAHGGVACHPVVVYTVDDGGDPTRAAGEVGSLVAEHKIVALVGTAAVLSFNGMVAGVEKAKIPVVGGDLAGFAWNENRWLFPQGAGLDAVVEERMHYVKHIGIDKIGMLYCVEAPACTEYAQRLPGIAERAGVRIVSTAPVSLTQIDFVAQCQNTKNAGATGMLIAMDGSSIARVARSCAALGYAPLLIANGLVISEAQAADPTIRKDHLLSTSSNAPWMLRDTLGQREFLDAITQYVPGFRPAGLALVTWAAGKLFEAAVAGLGPSARDSALDTAAVLTGLGRIHDETLGGLSPPITFSAGQAAAPVVRCAYVELLTEGGWTAPNGSSLSCGGRIK